MRKNSARARTISANLHAMLHAIADGDVLARNATLAHAVALHTADIDGGGAGYPLRWLCEIAGEHPDALAAAPDLAAFLAQARTHQQAYRHGQRDCRHGCTRCWNPYCAYTNGVAHQGWHAGWDDAFDTLVARQHPYPA